MIPIAVLLTGSLLGVAQPDGGPGERSIRFSYEVEIDEIDPGVKQLRLWIPVPGTDENQQILHLEVETHPEVEYRILKDAVYENRALFVQLDHEDGELPSSLMVRVIADVERKETSQMAAPSTVPVATLLAGDQLAPLSNEVVERSNEATAQANTDLERAKLIYQRVLADVEYDKTGTGWGRGDLHYVCEAGKGNCSDFHTLFVAMSRAVKIPAIFEIGFPIPTESTAGEIGGYHCWAWFEDDDGVWRPIDVSEADKDSSREEYFFGTIDENRIAMSRGRDIEFSPGPQAGPINFFVYPIAEMDGTVVEVRTECSYRDIEPRPAGGDEDWDQQRGFALLGSVRKRSVSDEPRP